MALALLAVAWLLTYLLHSTILLGGAWLLSATRTVRSALAHDTLWKVCLVGGLVTATVQTAFPFDGPGRRFWLPGGSAAQAQAAVSASPAASAPIASASQADRRAAVQGSSPAAPYALAPSTGDAGPGSFRAPVSASVPATPGPNPQSRTPGVAWPLILLGVWLFGAAGSLARLGLRRVRFCRRLGDRRELRDGELVEMLDSLRTSAGVRRRVRLAVSAELTGPVAMGGAEICLPERVLTSLAPAEQRAVLAHELGHLVRRDPTWLALGVVLENLLFVQPLNRMARRRVQEAAEYLCDDWAVRQTGGGLTLARCLAEVATWLQAPRRAVPVSGMAENRSQLVTRVQRLLDGVEPRAARGFRLAVPVAALALSSVAFAAPGVRPPCDEGGSGAAALATAGRHAGGGVPAGDHHTWATIRDGRLLTFRAGFAPSITGQGRLGIRRGGLAIEVMDDQHLTVNGRNVDEDEEVPVSEADTVRIVDEHGRTVWSFRPVWIASDETGEPADGDAESAAPDDWGDVGALADSAASLGVEVAGVVDVEALAAASTEIARATGRLGHEVTVKIAPRLARLQQMSERMASKAAPRLARMGMRIAASVGPAVDRALCGRAVCATAPRSAPVRRHRDIDGTKRLRP